MSYKRFLHLVAIAVNVSQSVLSCDCVDGVSILIRSRELMEADCYPSRVQQDV